MNNRNGECSATHSSAGRGCDLSAFKRAGLRQGPGEVSTQTLGYGKAVHRLVNEVTDGAACFARAARHLCEGRREWRIKSTHEHEHIYEGKKPLTVSEFMARPN